MPLPSFVATALPLLLPSSPLPSLLPSPLLLPPLPLPSLLHADKWDGDGDNTGHGVGNNVLGDKVGNGKGDKGIRHQPCCRRCLSPHLCCHGSRLHCCGCHHNRSTPLPSAQPLQRLSPSPTSLTPLSSRWLYGNKSGEKATGMVTTCAMATATRWWASKRAVDTATTRASAKSNGIGIRRALMMARKRTMEMESEGNGNGGWWGTRRAMVRAATNVMAMGTTRVMAMASMWQVMKWAMARVTRAIVTNAIAAVAIVLASAVMAVVVIAAAATTITHCNCPQCSNCSGYPHCPPL